jgi:uncharacterized protein (TIGR03790 family)
MKESTPATPAINVEIRKRAVGIHKNRRAEKGGRTETSYSSIRVEKVRMNFGFAIARRSYKDLIFLVLLIAAVSAVCEDETPAPTPLSDRVLVVFNRNDGGSREVAKYYAKMRGIPEKNLCSIAPIDPGSVNWKEYLTQVKPPIQKCLKEVGPEKILYIVFSYQTPFRLDGPQPDQRSGNGGFALDQFVADIWNQYAPDFPMGRQAQPYFAPARSKLNQYLPFVSLADYRAQPGAMTIYSVWRLDAADAKLAKGLVAKAIEAEKSGLKGEVCIDRRWPLNTIEDNGYGSGDWDLHRAAGFARQAGFKVIEDANDQEFGTPPAPMCPNAALYAGWYSLNNYNDAFTWNTGAIGIHLDSLSALNPRTGTNWVANAVKRGITVTTGAVGEPYLSGLLHPSGTFRDLFQGANVGDAFLRNTALLKWEILYIGDPLYRPFPDGMPPFAKKPQKEPPKEPAKEQPKDDKQAAPSQEPKAKSE